MGKPRRNIKRVGKSEGGKRKHTHTHKQKHTKKTQRIA
jgi:hypothetical protein